MFYNSPLPVHDDESESSDDAVTNTVSMRTPSRKRRLFAEDDNSAHVNPFGYDNDEVEEGGNNQIGQTGGEEAHVQILLHEGAEALGYLKDSSVVVLEAHNNDDERNMGNRPSKQPGRYPRLSRVNTRWT